MLSGSLGCRLPKQAFAKLADYGFYWTKLSLFLVLIGWDDLIRLLYKSSLLQNRCTSYLKNSPESKLAGILFQAVSSRHLSCGPDWLFCAKIQGRLQSCVNRKDTKLWLVSSAEKRSGNMNSGMSVSLLSRISGEEPREVRFDLFLSIVFIMNEWSYWLKSCGSSENYSQKDSFQVRGISTMTTVGPITDNCIMPSEPAPMSEPTVWTAGQGMVWGIINSSVKSCWLILIEVNVGAEKYFDWWGWQEAPPLRRPWVSHLEGSACHRGLLVSLKQALAGVQEYWTGDGLGEDVHAVITSCPLYGSFKPKNTPNC